MVSSGAPKAMRSDWEQLFSEISSGMALSHCRHCQSPTEDCGWRPWMARSRWGNFQIPVFSLTRIFEPVKPKVKDLSLAPSSGGLKYYLHKTVTSPSTCAKNRLLFKSTDKKNSSLFFINCFKILKILFLMTFLFRFTTFQQYWVKKKRVSMSFNMLAIVF